MQPDFSRAVLELCRDSGIPTAIETCGKTSWRVLKKLSPVTDLFLYDLKHPDPKLHRKYTGASNKLILSNLRRLVQGGAEVTVRVPLIPGFNDGRDLVRATGQNALAAGVRRVTLLPYNPASAGKYAWLHRRYPLGDLERQSDAHVAELEELLLGDGLEPVAP
jgi:pyruvate formate lyase activating enzyme